MKNNKFLMFLFVLILSFTTIFSFSVSYASAEEIKALEEIVQSLRFWKSETNKVEAIIPTTKIAELEEEERNMFLTELGLSESGLDRLVKTSYRLLGLISYLTAGEKEVRAWTIESGTKAPQAAGKIHTDFEKGFIRAEIVDYDILVELGSFNAAKEKGKVRSEGKDYVVKDGDVVLFRFNV